MDSTPIYDSVATKDTVTQLRSAIRKLLRALDRDYPLLAARVRVVVVRDDDYVGQGKPPCDWDDPAAREALVDALVRDCGAALAVIDGEALQGPAAAAAELLAIVAGQDVESGADGVFCIARRVAADRVISTVDVEARHGHKSHDRRFDGFKAHLSVDPDSELIDEVVVTAGNVHDSAPVTDLLAGHADDKVKPTVMGDCAYGTAETLERLADAGYEDVKPEWRPPGDGLDASGRTTSRSTLTQAACRVRPGRPHRLGSPLTARGRSTSLRTAPPARSESPARRRGGPSPSTQRRPPPSTQDRPSRPGMASHVYRDPPESGTKIGHFVRRGWGGRKARVRGKTRIGTDADTCATAVNWARLATLGVTRIGGAWTAAPL